MKERGRRERWESKRLTGRKGGTRYQKNGAWTHYAWHAVQPQLDRRIDRRMHAGPRHEPSPIHYGIPLPPKRKRKVVLNPAQGASPIVN